MDTRIKDLIAQGDALFSKRSTLMSFWQESAENFYPERADFTVTRTMGDSFADNLDTSYPIMARRELGNTFSAMLRPSEKDWFKVGTMMEVERDSEEARRALEKFTRIQRRAMYDRDACFNRATKEGDNDYAAFGNAVISAEFDVLNMSMLYRCWHLRDVVWGETYNGKTCPVHRKWKPSAVDLAKRIFPGKVHAKVTELLSKTPLQEVNCRHIIVKSDEYDPPAGKKKWLQPYVSIHIDVENQHVMEEKGSWVNPYIIPRWQTVSGSQYAYSPAVVAAMPDARLIQAMTYTLLTAGEMAVNPAMIGVQEALRSDLNVYPGGFTSVDADYDERLGEVLRPLSHDSRGIPLGMEMARDLRSLIAEAFFLNKINLPQRTGDVTAYEVSQMVQQYVRGALPLFEPMESDYNGALCEVTFEILMRQGAFAPMDANGQPDIPDILRGKDIQFSFENPLRSAAEASKGQLFMQAKELMAQAAPLDPTAVQMVDAAAALRDALHGIGTPSEWMRDEAQMEQIRATEAQAKQAQAILSQVSQGAEIAKQVGDAGQSMTNSGMM